MSVNPFGAADMAAGYARSRPPVHGEVIGRAVERMGGRRFRRAVDIGCGAGLSTAPLARLAERVVGMEPAEPMLRWTATTAPGASFVVGSAEALPFADGGAELMTAAGSLNYVALDRFFPEAARVVGKGGMLLVYDFSPGRESASAPALAKWFESFMERYPPPAAHGHPISPADLKRPGFRLGWHEEFAIPLELEPDFYLDYMLTETNVASAVAGGTPLSEIRAWCAAGLAEVFKGAPQTILFRGYVTYLDREV